MWSYRLHLYRWDLKVSVSDWTVCRLLATTSADQTCKIWRTADHTLMTELKENTQRWVWDCAFSGDSQYIITGRTPNRSNVINILNENSKWVYDCRAGTDIDFAIFTVIDFCAKWGPYESSMNDTCTINGLYLDFINEVN